MKDAKKIRMIDDIILNLEISQEKVAVMIGDIDQNYFDLKDDYCKLHYFDRTGIKFDIILDYVFQMGNNLTEIRKILNGMCEKEGGAA